MAKTEETYFAQSALRLKDAEINRGNVLANLMHIEEEERRVARKIEIIEKDIVRFDLQTEQAQGKSAGLTERKKELENEYVTLTESKDRLEEELENRKKKIENKRIEELTLEKRAAAAKERAELLSKEEENRNKELEKGNLTIITLKKRLEETEQVFSDKWSERYATLEEERNETVKSQIKLSEELSALLKREEDLSQLIQSLRTEINSINVSVRDNGNQTAKFEERQAGLAETRLRLENEMNELYGEKLDSVWQEYNINKKHEDIKSEIEEAQSKISGLGLLNMAAAKDYNEKKQIAEIQMKQLADVEQAMKSLNNLIKEKYEVTKVQFKETFAQVREKYIEAFTKLIGGGEADLLLTDPDNLLESGVDVKFIPPGKKIKNKNLLSGGEKALAALVLLFALFLHKATPFCFLDEVDAPLDDANQEKFIYMLKTLSEQTQLVIVTHKHLTMAAADSLYGITMQEGGVSAVLSVKLN
jgi:chromosome segregation protein